VSIDDRVRAATEAVAATVREVPSLSLPPDAAPAGAEPGRPRRSRPARDLRRAWGGWLIPLAAAVAVIAVAATLVAVRQASTPDVPSAPPIGYTRVPGSDYTMIPRYYAAISESPTASSDLYVWYLLRIAPGTAHPYRLTRLPIKPLRAAFPAAALSPDGQALAVLSSSKTGAGSGPATDLSAGATMIQLYSVSSGALSRTWTVNEEAWAVSAGGLQFSTFSWLADGRQLAFSSGLAKGKTVVPQERLLDVTAPSGALLAASQAIFALPQPVSSRCDALTITPDGGTIICGTQTGAGSQAGCARLTAYSVQTGQPVRVLYRDPDGCDGGAVAVPVWASLSAEHVVVVLRHDLSPVVGLVAGGRFTKLPPALQSRDLYTAAF
jgi:hypothetical protein